MVFAAVKKDGANKTPSETKQSEKVSEERKGTKTQNMPTSEELRGDSPSGLAANAPFRSGSKVPFEVLQELYACIVKHPPKSHLKLLSRNIDFL